MTAWFSESIMDCALFDADGFSVGDVSHPPMSHDEMQSYPHKAILNFSDKLQRTEKFALFVRVSWLGLISDDILPRIVARLDRGEMVCILAWNRDALEYGRDAIWKLVGGGQA